ncbi:unnamed protein product [Adineta steineri]|uniref:Uncharacterized protein n=1 Tax=Adineta steineri TaxID=433720 RepID=A0A818P643_9BILA|nr:unnamed protein product [Adineta steineri]CAF1137883.1 unnamed protein product [Adineta steineri]CAF3571060.1 unnamed protein product [Adineta steineri]CAF3581497.1 unnamed protein product [Adineta steineri]CAF3618848.1 unnamed protein product [Adineta steineri]
MIADPLNRKLSFVGAFFAFVGVILGVVALATNYWTVDNMVTPGTAMSTGNGTILMRENTEWKWNGLFYMCATRANNECESNFMPIVFILCLLGVIFLLVGGIFLCWDMFKISNRRFIIPMLMFMACVLMTAGLFEYGSMARLNSHSSRTMIAAIVFAYSALPIAAFIAGRYSVFDRFVTNGHVANGQKYVATSNGN